MGLFEHVTTGERVESKEDSVTAVLLSSPSWKEVKATAAKKVTKQGKEKGAEA